MKKDDYEKLDLDLDLDLERRKILVVGKNEEFPKEIINYAINLAERLDYDILALSIIEKREANSSICFRQSLIDFEKKANQNGIFCTKIVKFGDLKSVIEEVSHHNKRIEFMLVNSDSDRKKLENWDVSIPMFSIKKGENIMETKTDKKKLFLQTIGYGAATAGLYAAVFMNSETIMSYFTKGGWYAALPIATVFLFSFVHGTFTSNLWSLLGIEAVKKGATIQPTERKVVQKQKTAKKRPRAYAYVNPFHKL